MRCLQLSALLVAKLVHISRVRYTALHRRVGTPSIRMDRFWYVVMIVRRAYQLTISSALLAMDQVL